MGSAAVATTAALANSRIMGPAQLEYPSRPQVRLRLEINSPALFAASEQSDLILSKIVRFERTTIQNSGAVSGLRVMVAMTFIPGESFSTRKLFREFNGSQRI